MGHIANKRETFEKLCNGLQSEINAMTAIDQDLIFRVIGSCDLMALATKIRDLNHETKRLHVFLHYAKSFHHLEFLEELSRLDQPFYKRLIGAIEFVLFDTKQQFTLNHYL